MARVLIVDDEKPIRELIREVLSAQGHEFELAADGAEAFASMRKRSFDLAIVDRNMPGVTGIEVVEAIRKDPKTAAMKVLMCTASSVPLEIDEAFAAGADDYILKPLNFPELMGKVARALAVPAA